MVELFDPSSSWHAVLCCSFEVLYYVFVIIIVFVVETKYAEMKSIFEKIKYEIIKHKIICWTENIYVIFNCEKTHVVKFWPKYGINMNKFVPCPYLLNSSNCLFGSSVSNWPCNNVFILVVDCVIIWRERTLFNDSYKKWLTISFIWYFYNRHSHKTITTDIRKSKNITRLITTIIPKTL